MTPPPPPLPIQLGGLEERCKLPQWGLGRSPSRQTIWCILQGVKECSSGGSSFCWFSWDAIPHRAASYEELLFLGHSPPLPWKSALMADRQTLFPYLMSCVSMCWTLCHLAVSDSALVRFVVKHGIEWCSSELSSGSQCYVLFVALQCFCAWFAFTAVARLIFQRPLRRSLGAEFAHRVRCAFELMMIGEGILLVPVVPLTADDCTVFTGHLLTWIVIRLTWFYDFMISCLYWYCMFSFLLFMCVCHVLRVRLE